MNKRDFLHVIITRYNVRGYESSDVPSKEWFQKRTREFKSVCLPSILNQSNSNFYWFLFFDSSTDTELINFLPNLPWIRVIKIPFWDINLVRKHLFTEIKDYKYLLTTRLDNDDALAKNYVEIIQNRFDGQKLCFINPDKGIILDKVNKKVYLRNSFVNSWITLIEKVCDKNIMTVFADQHQNIYKNYKVLRIKKPIMWLMNVHGDNLGNSVKSHHLLIKASNLKQFSLKLENEVSDVYSIYTINNLKRFIAYNLFLFLRPIVKFYGKYTNG